MLQLFIKVKGTETQPAVGNKQNISRVTNVSAESQFAFSDTWMMLL